MPESPRHLRFRSDERREVALPASLTLAERDTEQLRLSAEAFSSRARIDGTMVDISGGGAGVVVAEYVPKWAHIVLHVHRTENDTESLMRAPGIVRRVRMLDRRPSYLLGIGFESLTDDEYEQIATLIAGIDGLEVERA